MRRRSRPRLLGGRHVERLPQAAWIAAGTSAERARRAPARAGRRPSRGSRGSPGGIAGSSAPRVADVHALDADASRRHERLQATRQRLEVARRAGGELPVEVDRQPHVAGRRRLPRGPERGVRRRRPAEAAQHAGVEGRHETRGVALVRARAGAARRCATRSSTGWPRSSAGEVDGAGLASAPARAPRPTTRRGRAARVRRPPRARRMHRQRAPGLDARRVDQRQVDDDQHAPRAEPVVRAARRRREQPREVGRVELDEWEVVGLDVGAAGTRIGADDEARVDADDVARPVQRQVEARARGSRSASARPRPSRGRAERPRCRRSRCDRRGRAGPRAGSGTCWRPRQAPASSNCSTSCERATSAALKRCSAII